MRQKQRPFDCFQYTSRRNPCRLYFLLWLMTMHTYTLHTQNHLQYSLNSRRIDSVCREQTPSLDVCMLFFLLLFSPCKPLCDRKFSDSFATVSTDRFNHFWTAFINFRTRSVHKNAIIHWTNKIVERIYVKLKMLSYYTLQTVWLCLWVEWHIKNIHEFWLCTKILPHYALDNTCIEHRCQCH